MNLAEYIAEESRQILDKENGAIVGQCLTAVGWVNGTIPKITDKNKVIELPMTETAGMEFSVGLALSGRPTIHVIRFQSFLFLQSSPLAFYANMARDIWDYDIPLLVRAIGDESYHGPVHSNTYHSMFVEMGVQTFAPVTPKDYQEALASWREHKVPVLLSEHRHTYRLTDEEYVRLETNVSKDNDIIIIAISATRIAAQRVADRINDELNRKAIGVVHLNDLYFPNLPREVSKVKNIIILDTDNMIGVVNEIISDIHYINKNANVIGLYSSFKCVDGHGGMPDEDLIELNCECMLEGL